MIKRKIKLTSANNSNENPSYFSSSNDKEETKSGLPASFNRVFAIILVICTFLIPWFFNSYTYEFYETSKNSILLLTVALIMLFIAVKVVRRKKVQLLKTPFDVFILIFVISQVLSVITSISKETSIWGFNSRLTGGLISTLGLLAFYYLVVNNVNEKISKYAIKAFTLSVGLLALFTVLKGFNVFAGLFEEMAKTHPSLEFLKSPLFTPIGNPNSLVYLFIMSLPLALSFVFKKEQMAKIFGVLTSCALLLGIGITSAANGINEYNLVIWLIVMVIFIFFVFKELKTINYNSITFLIPLIAVTVLAFVFSIDSGLREKIQLNYTRYYEIPFNTSWSVITGTYNEYKIGGFLVGTGLDTYAYNFPRFRPVEQNLQPNWFENYTRSSSQIESILVNTGLLGLIAMILLAGAIIYFIIKNILNKEEVNKHPMNLALSLMILLYFVSFFILYLPITIHFLFWLSLALLVKNYYSSHPEKNWYLDLNLQMATSEGKKPKNIAPGIFAVLLTFLALITMFIITKNYLAEIQYKKSLVAANFGDLNNANDFAVQAINNNDQRDYYHRQLATVGLMFLRKITAEPAPAQGSQEETTRNQNTNYFLNLTTQELNRAIALNPNNFENLQLATLIYKQLVDLSQGKLFGDQALQSVAAAVKLNPTNPDNYLLLGFLYQFNENEELQKQAEQYYIRAYNLQPGYPISIFTLGNYLESLGKKNDAMTVYQNSLQLFYQQEGTQINSLLKQKISELEGKVETTTTTTPVPTETGF